MCFTVSTQVFSYTLRKHSNVKRVNPLTAYSTVFFQYSQPCCFLDSALGIAFHYLTEGVRVSLKSLYDSCCWSILRKPSHFQNSVTSNIPCHVHLPLLAALQQLICTPHKHLKFAVKLGIRYQSLA